MGIQNPWPPALASDVVQFLDGFWKQFGALPQVALQRRQQRLRIWAKAAVKRWVSGRPAGTILPDTVPEKIGITPLDAVVATAVGSKCVRMLSRTPCFPRLNTKVRGSGFLAESVPSVTCVRFFFCVWEACVGA